MDSSAKKDRPRRPVRRIAGDILLFLDVLLAADVAAVMIRRIRTVVLKETYGRIFLYEIILLLVFLLFALDIRFDFLTGMKRKEVRWIGWIGRIAVTAAAAVVIFLSVRVVIGGWIYSAGSASKAVVLGMALENGEPTKDLIKRLDTAEDYLRENSGSVLILTGGNPDASGRTEAAIMRDLLLSRGVPEEKMILEDRATTTRENFENTADLIEPDEPVCLITSDYHMDRAVKTARKAGLTRVLRRPAPSDIFSYGANVAWEVVMALEEMKYSLLSAFAAFL